ncbi:MAG: hypothetical protein PVH45_01045, partial [Candidatus Omnitrophota bacterium]
MTRYNLWLKAVSVITILAFMFSQIAWTQESLIGPAPIQEEDNRSGMLSPEELMDAQNRAEMLIASKDELGSSQDLLNALSARVSDDLYIEYKGKDVYGISSPGLFAIDAVKFDKELERIFSVPFSFEEGDSPLEEDSYIRLSLPDGTSHLYAYSPLSDGFLSQEKLVETVTADNTMVAYANGLVDTILKADGDISRYTYVFDEAKSLAGIVQAKSDATRVFDADGNLEYLYVGTTEGYTEICYEDGAPRVLTKPNGTSYLYTYEENNGSIDTYITLLRYVNEDGSVVDFEDEEPVQGAPEADTNTALRVIQGPDGVIKEVKDLEGSTFFYDDKGTITGSLDADGKETSYDYEYDPETGDLMKTTIVSGAVTIEYGTDGNIDRAYVGEGEERMMVEFGSGKVKKVVSNENILFYTYREDPDTGEEITCVNAYAAHVKTKYDDSGRLSELMFPDGTSILYSRDETGLITRSEVYRNDVLIEVFDYSYISDLTVVKDT